MASAVRSMRLCVRGASRRAVAPKAPVTRRQLLTIRPFSSTPFQRRQRTDEEEIAAIENEDEEDAASAIDPVALRRALQAMREDGDYESARRLQERVVNKLGGIFTEAMRAKRPRNEDFWMSEETDPDLLMDEGNTENFEEDDIMSMGHAKFEEFREYREYARIAAWQMPLLSKLATPFEPPTAAEPLRFRYTSYMGELHPAERKVVVEFCPEDMPLDEPQKEKLKKLLGVRWNPETGIAKMSCEQFEHQAQNKRYLSDLVNKLVAEAKDPKDMFTDIPIDTRHHTSKTKPKFPKEWRMTDERRAFLEDFRKQQLLLDESKEAQGKLIDGVQTVNELSSPENRFAAQPVPVRVKL